MTIEEVTTKKLINTFHQIPYRIYRSDKNWIPHIKQDIEKVFDPTKNKAHSNGKIIRWILFDSTQKPIGRIAAFVNFEQAKTDNQPTGGIGFFE
ncbi:MAG: GNAT family N-acetyltransferase, partial [Flavobacteriales bacterium]|nr:GNAT family N-acetyltransferase [Flavobacteriales bacterium]